MQPDLQTRTFMSNVYSAEEIIRGNLLNMDAEQLHFAEGLLTKIKEVESKVEGLESKEESLLSRIKRLKSRLALWEDR